MYSKFIDICHMLWNAGLETVSSGNFSIKLQTKSFLIKPSWLRYDDIIKNDQICKVMYDENYKLIVQTKLQPSSDRKQHAIIYDNNPEINAIVHTHSHYATVFAIIHKNIPVLSTMHADVFWKEIECLNFVNHRTKNFWDLISYKRWKCFLLGNHWAIIIWKNIDEAAKSTIYLEEIAKLYYHSLLIKKDVENCCLDEPDINIINKYYEKSYWNNH